MQGPDPGEGRGQPRQLPLCQAGAAREPWCLPRQILEQSEGAASPWLGARQACSGGKFLLWDPPGEEKGNLGTTRLRGTRSGMGRAGPALRQVVALSLAHRELRALGLPSWMFAHKHGTALQKGRRVQDFSLPVCSSCSASRCALIWDQRGEAALLFPSSSWFGTVPGQGCVSWAPCDVPAARVGSAELPPHIFAKVG